MNASALRFAATCVPGAEPWVVKELSSLGLKVAAGAGAVTGRARLGELRRVLGLAKLVESVRVRPVQSFHAENFEALCRGIEKVPWHAYLVSGIALEVRVTCRKSRLYHSDAVAERVRRVIESRTKRDWAPPESASINAHHNRVYVRLDSDEVEVGIDASGEALHRRGYRRHVEEAPIRETLAALLLALANDAATHSPIVRLWDPCCGSGTIVLEWLAQFLRLDAKRPFIMDQWPCFAGGAELQSLVSESDVNVIAPRVWGSDILQRAIAASEANADTLGVRHACRFAVSDFGAFEREVPEATALVTNLPYGVRLDSRQAAGRLFQRLDALLVRRVDLRPAVVLWGGGKHTPELSNPWQIGLSFKNGGLAVSAFVLR